MEESWATRFALAVLLLLVFIFFEDEVSSGGGSGSWYSNYVQLHGLCGLAEGTCVLQPRDGGLSPGIFQGEKHWKSRVFSIQQQEESPLNVTVADASRTSTCIMASVSVKSVASMSLEHGDSRPQLILYFDNCREKRKSSEVFSIPISQLALLIPIVEDHETSCTFLPWMCSLSDWEFRDQCTSTTTSSTMTYSSSTMTASSFTATASSTVQARLRAGMASAYFTKPSSLCYLMSHEMRSDSATKCEDECIPHASHDCDGYTYQDGICRLYTKSPHPESDPPNPYCWGRGHLVTRRLQRKDREGPSLHRSKGPRNRTFQSAAPQLWRLARSAWESRLGRRLGWAGVQERVDEMLHGARGPSSITTTTISTTTRTQTSTTSSSTTSSTSRSTTTTTTEPREVLKLATILQPMDEAEEAYELRIDDGRERQRFWGSFNSVDAGGRSRLYQLPRHLGLKTCPEDVAVLKASLRNSTMARREDKSSLRSDATCTPNLCHRSLDQTVGLKWLNILLLGYLSQCFVSHALKRTGLGWLWTFGIQRLEHRAALFLEWAYDQRYLDRTADYNQVPLRDLARVDNSPWTPRSPLVDVGVLRWLGSRPPQIQKLLLELQERPTKEQLKDMVGIDSLWDELYWDDVEEKSKARRIAKLFQLFLVSVVILGLFCFQSDHFRTLSLLLGQLVPTVALMLTSFLLLCVSWLLWWSWYRRAAGKQSLATHLAELVRVQLWGEMSQSDARPSIPEGGVRLRVVTSMAMSKFSAELQKLGLTAADVQPLQTCEVQKEIMLQNLSEDGLRLRDLRVTRLDSKVSFDWSRGGDPYDGSIDEFLELAEVAVKSNGLAVGYFLREAAKLQEELRPEARRDAVKQVCGLAVLCTPEAVWDIERHTKEYQERKYRCGRNEEMPLAGAVEEDVWEHCRDTAQKHGSYALWLLDANLEKVSLALGIVVGSLLFLGLAYLRLSYECPFALWMGLWWQIGPLTWLLLCLGASAAYFGYCSLASTQRFKRLNYFSSQDLQSAFQEIGDQDISSLIVYAFFPRTLLTVLLALLICNWTHALHQGVIREACPFAPSATLTKMSASDFYQRWEQEDVVKTAFAAATVVPALQWTRSKISTAVQNRRRAGIASAGVANASASGAGH